MAVATAKAAALTGRVRGGGREMGAFSIMGDRGGGEASSDGV